MKRKRTNRRSAKKPEVREPQRPSEFSKAHPLVLTCACGLFLLGVFFRVHLLNRSLWLDEAWVANSLTTTTLYESFYYADWLQTTPPLFIMIARITSHLIGSSNWAFRLIPALAAILSLCLLIFIAWRFLQPYFALLALLLFALSPNVILYSQSLKQYSTDIFATLAFITLALMYFERRAARWFAGLVGGFFILALLSYQVVFFLPFLLLVAVDDRYAIFAGGERASRTAGGWTRIFFVCLVGVTTVGVNYVFFIAPNRNADLHSFFSDGFYEGSGIVSLLGYIWVRLRSVTSPFFFGSAGAWGIVGLLITSFGLARLWRAGLRERSIALFAAILFSAPFFTVFAANSLGLYPLPGFDHRLLIYILPITTLLFCLGLQHLAQKIAAPIAAWVGTTKVSVVQNRLGAGIFTAFLAFSALFLVTTGFEPFFAWEYEDVEQAVRGLSKNVNRDDLLYVHATMREPFKLYIRRYPVRAAKVIHGRVGSPCCPRENYRDPRLESMSDIGKELKSLREAAAGHSLWILNTNRESHVDYLGRNDVELFDRGLAILGCGRNKRMDYRGVVIEEFICR